MNDGDLADFLAECGAVVGGSTALARAFPTDPVAWAARMAPYGGVLGVAALVFRWTGVK